MPRFLIEDELPLEANREEFYITMRSLKPQNELCDEDSLEVVDNRIQCTNKVPFWRKYTVSHTDLQTGALTNSVALFTLEAGGIIEAVKIKHSEAFAGASITDYDVSVGINGSTAKYAPLFDVDSAVSDTNYDVSAILDGETHNAAGTVIYLSAVAVGANLSASTAGSVDVWIKWGVAL